MYVSEYDILGKKIKTFGIRSKYELYRNLVPKDGSKYDFSNKKYVTCYYVTRGVIAFIEIDTTLLKIYINGIIFNDTNLVINNEIDYLSLFYSSYRETDKDSDLTKIIPHSLKNLIELIEDKLDVKYNISFDIEFNSFKNIYHLVKSKNIFTDPIIFQLHDDNLILNIVRIDHILRINPSVETRNLRLEYKSQFLNLKKPKSYSEFKTDLINSLSDSMQINNFPIEKAEMCRDINIDLFKKAHYNKENYIYYLTLSKLNIKLIDDILYMFDSSKLNEAREYLIETGLHNKCYYFLRNNYSELMNNKLMPIRNKYYMIKFGSKNRPVILFDSPINNRDNRYQSEISKFVSYPISNTDDMFNVLSFIYCCSQIDEFNEKMSELILLVS